jgi:hypothetical protein
MRGTGEFQVLLLVIGTVTAQRDRKLEPLIA